MLILVFPKITWYGLKYFIKTSVPGFIDLDLLALMSGTHSLSFNSPSNFFVSTVTYCAFIRLHFSACWNDHGLCKTVGAWKQEKEILRRTVSCNLDWRKGGGWNVEFGYGDTAEVLALPCQLTDRLWMSQPVSQLYIKRLGCDDDETKHCKAFRALSSGIAIIFNDIWGISKTVLIPVSLTLIEVTQLFQCLTNSAPRTKVVIAEPTFVVYVMDLCSRQGDEVEPRSYPDWTVTRGTTWD